MSSKRLRREMQALDAADAKRAATAKLYTSALAQQGLATSKGYLEPETDLEKTYKVTQSYLAQHTDRNTRTKQLALEFPSSYGEYVLDYTRNGRFVLLGSRKGHVALIDVLRRTEQCEMHVEETVRDVCALHNHTLFAVAQNKYVYVYDSKGVEIHVLRKHIQPTRLSFLHRHYLLASVGRGGFVKYQDISTGELVHEANTRMGFTDVMSVNPSNAVVALGHTRGTVTMWTPNQSTFVVKMKCHVGPVKEATFTPDGNYLCTAGVDNKLSVWDLRMSYKRLHSYHAKGRTVRSLDVSQTGLLAVGYGAQVDVWKDAISTKASEPYLAHASGSTSPCGRAAVSRVRFRPYEDVLGIGHERGYESIVVPGSGAASYDTAVDNPFEHSKERKAKEVKSLLEKLPRESIVLDPSEIGGVDEMLVKRVKKDRKRVLELEKNERIRKKVAGENKGAGKSDREKARLKRKKSNVIDKQREETRERVVKEAREKKAKTVDAPRDALSRFR